jgi:hypothetical protein
MRVMLMLLCCGGLSVAQTIEHLADVKSVAVAVQVATNTNDNQDTLAEALRGKLIAALVKDGVPVSEFTDDPGSATLTGTCIFQTAGRAIHVSASVRLLAQSGKVVWADTINTTVLFGGASSAISEKVARSLANAMRH